MTCPYDTLAPANLVVCERDLCGWITQPANTWTNIGFVLVGLWILRAARRDGASRAGWLGLIAIATGVASAAFHGTSTLVGQLLDQSVMFLETGLFIALEIARLRPRAPVAAIFVAIVVVSTALLLAFPTLGIALFAVHAVAFVALEVVCFVRARAPSYRALAGAFAIFAVSYGLWWLDMGRLVCDPDNHVFTLHGAWHLLGALSFALYYRHFAAVTR